MSRARSRSGRAVADRIHRRIGAAPRTTSVLAWIDDIFRYYDIDPTTPDRWEQGFWFLAARAFPNFRLVNSSRIGRTKATAKRADLLIEFEGSRRKRGSKYKHFLADHAAVCCAAGVKTINGLKAAILKANLSARLSARDLSCTCAMPLRGRSG